MGIAHGVMPISNDPIRTVVQTEQGNLAFSITLCESAVNRR